MDLELVEPHPQRVLAAFRQGDFDGLEILGQADEKAFFELCFREKLLEALDRSPSGDWQGTVRHRVRLASGSPSHQQALCPSSSPTATPTNRCADPRAHAPFFHCLNCKGLALLL
jgi:hypothetical protein